MRRALLLRILHLRRNAILFLLLVLMLLYFTIPGIRSAELNYIRQDEAIHVTLVIFGGYEGGQTKIDLYSGSLLSKEADTLRQMINDANFFDLPEVMSSKKRRCFDCYHYKMTVTSREKRHAVAIDTERTEVPLALQPLLNWLLKQSRDEERSR